jgi:opacity protein-like surface antigen
MNRRFPACTLVTTLLLGGALLPGSARAEDERGVIVFAQGGGYSPVTDLDDAGSASFKTGFAVGGGVGYQFNRHVALRGNFTFARTEADAPAFGFDATKFNRFLYDADVQLRYPTQSGFTPYVFAGGGATTIKQDIDSDPPSFTKGAGKVGVGVAYEIADSNLSVYAEGTGWLYKWDRNGFDKTQFDVAWTAGLSYRFGR